MKKYIKVYPLNPKSERPIKYVMKEQLIDYNPDDCNQ